MATKNNKKTPNPPSTPPTKIKKTLAVPMLPQDSPLTIVGIGASAGGLKALQTFFESLPEETGLAFVVITHLHPEYESHLAEILQNHTRMTVVQVMEKVNVEPDHVYVIPPNQRIFMTDQKLDVKKFDEPRGLRTPVDHFFRSLALAQHHIVGIILSGSGTDGSVGIKAIKESGGLLLAQYPEEAEYDSMPRAAIATGIVDAVLSVRELAAVLMRYVQNPASLPHDPEQLTPVQQETLTRILAQVQARTGHDFSQYKRATILRRIQRRMQLGGHESLEAYLGHLRHNINEANAMFNDILIGVTNFFRDSKSWDAVASKAIPALFEGKESGDSIRTWTIGCSTGEEAYTLAMLLLEHADNLEKKFQIQVFASDLDDHSLMQAREGIYPAAIEADVSTERLEKFFIKQDSHYQIRRELRDIVLFTNHSVLRDPPFSKLDLISCRNLLIYLQREMHENIFDTFHYALNPGGYLFLGAAESADLVKDLFQVVDKSNRIYLSKPWHGDHPHVPILPLRAPRTRHTDGYIAPRPMHRRFVNGMPPLEEQHLRTLEAFGPPSIWVDEEHLILNISETAGRYLFQPGGSITSDVVKLVRPELQTELRSALFQAFDKGKAIVCPPIAVKFNGAPHGVVMSVRPEKRAPEAGGDLSRRALVVFLEDENDASDQNETRRSAENRTKAQDDALVEQLEHEVQYLRERLQASVEEFNSSNEEMKASNEELQSINEEYRSTTEELETSKEELQSVNEELHTVNNELRNKFDEVTRANSDMENLMDSTRIATLFLDRELKIKRFTPGMKEVFNIRSSDRGRPIADFTHTLEYKNLVEDARQVLEKLVSLEREAIDGQGSWFLIRLRPYRTVDDRIEGVVISFVDITSAKKAEGTRRSYELFYTLFHANPVPTMLARLDNHQIMNVNAAFLEHLDLKREEVVGHSARDFNIMSQEVDLALKEENVRNFEAEVKLPSGEKKTMLISTKQIFIEETEAILSTFIDITERADAERQIRHLNIERAAAELRERRRIAQLLHDDLQQRIFAIKMHLERLEDGFARNDVKSAKDDFAKLELWLVEAIAMTRKLSSDISPLSISGSTLTEVIVWLTSEMKEQYGLETSFDANGVQPNLNSNMLSVLLQALRELLFNIVKHSGTNRAAIKLEMNDSKSVRIVVSDSGKGFDAEELRTKEADGGGVANVRHQLGIFGCTLDMDSEPGNGTHAIISVPIPKSESQP